MPELLVEVTPSRITKVFAKIVIFLGFMQIAGKISALGLGHSYWHGLIPLFDMDGEYNVPAAYSGFALAFSAGLLVIIASVEAKRDRMSHVAFWTMLAVVFLFLAVDELFGLHEKLVDPLRESLNTTGVLYFAWIIPYGIATVAFGLFCVRFLTKLPRHISASLVLAGTVYISGAIGMEMIGGTVAEPLEKPELDPSYVVVTTLEELLEMTGVVIFIHALLSYLALLGTRIEFRNDASDS